MIQKLSIYLCIFCAFLIGFIVGESFVFIKIVNTVSDLIKSSGVLVNSNDLNKIVSYGLHRFGL